MARSLVSADRLSWLCGQEELEWLSCPAGQNYKCHRRQLSTLSIIKPMFVQRTSNPIKKQNGLEIENPVGSLSIHMRNSTGSELEDSFGSYQESSSPEPSNSVSLTLMTK